MDLPLYLSVLWRFKWLTIAGFGLGFVLAVLAMVSVKPGLPPQLAYRQPELYRSDVTLLVTQSGFPWGRSIVSEGVPLNFHTDVPMTLPSLPYVPRFPDPTRFEMLASLYSKLATGDDVRRLIQNDGKGPMNGKVGAEPLFTTGGASTLPMVRLTAISDSPVHAVSLAQRASTAFRKYLTQQQDANKVPETERVLVPVVTNDRVAVLFAGRSLVRPMFAFMLMSILTVGLCFLLENLRPRAQSRSELRIAQ
jgi:hypothetical protein